jgi:hypothetical protein
MDCRTRRDARGRLERERGRLMIALGGDGAVSLGLFVFFSTRDDPSRVLSARWRP